jgi:cardiolipin synthase
MRIRRLFWSWWPWAIGGLALAYTGHWGWAAGSGALATVSFLIAPKADPPRYGLDNKFAIDSPEFLPTIAGVTNTAFSSGNSVELLNNGDQFYPRMLGDVERAERSITIEAYIYWAGEVGVKFARALDARARAGVTVKILLDAIGSATIGKDILDILEPACAVEWFNPIHWYTIGRFNNRTHRKSLIIDGRVGYTGGAGIADHWKGNAESPQSWRDMQIRIDGPGITPLQAGFAENWRQTTGELISGDDFFPEIQAQGALDLQTILSSPAAGGSNIRTMYYMSIACARRSIYIANPYFVPDAVAIDMLIEARRRGVQVRIMVSGIRNDNWLARQNSVRLYGQLLEADIEILEFNRTMLHHKTMVIDGLWGTIGTTNFDNRSFAHNEESNVCFFDRTLAGELHQTFLADVDGCNVITIDEWRRRGLWSRLQETAASVMQEQA